MDYEVLDPVQHELVIKNEFDAPEINPALAFIATLHRGTSRYTMTSKLNVVARWLGLKTSVISIGPRSGTSTFLPLLPRCRSLARTESPT